MSIIETLHYAIFESERAGSHLTEIAISDKAAWELAGEFAPMLYPPGRSASDIYRGIKAGDAKFMGRNIVVAE